MSAEPPPADGTAHAAFCRGERPDDVLLYLPDRTVSAPDALAAHGERVADGTVLVLPGERGRSVLSQATGIEAMALARRAADTEGRVDRACTGGTCPAGSGSDHRVDLLFAFAEPETPEAGGRYAEGAVVHAYVVCGCGTAYSDRWVVDG